MMQKIAIAGTDLNASEIALGTGEWGSSVSVDRVAGVLDAYLAAGGNFIDTAHCYAFWLEDGKALGKSEITVGEMVRKRGLRKDMIIATKGGHENGGKAYPRPKEALARHLVERDLKESLDRLQMERVDLYYLHRDDGVTPVDEVMAMMNDFVAQGLVRWIGASNWSIARLSAANEYARTRGLQGFCCSQVHWSLAEPTFQMHEDPTMRYVDEPMARWHAMCQMPLIAYSPTARGFFATAGKRREGYDTAANRGRLTRAQELAAELKCTANQVAIAWLRAQAFPVVAITGTASVEHLDDTVRACEIALTAQQVRWLWEGKM
jgi:aryl-alcohol dehydrogenase-like predicted oxidoreductase